MPRRAAAEPRTRSVAKEETREALLAAAMEEFAARGLDAPSLDAICARAGFTRGAFYVHFDDREDLIAAAMERVLGAFLDAVLEGDDAGGDLPATVARFAASLTPAGDAPTGGVPAGLELPSAVPFHQLLAACRRSPEVRTRFVQVLEQAVARIAGAAEGDDALARLLLCTAIGVRVAQEIDLPFSPTALRDAALTLLAARDR